MDEKDFERRLGRALHAGVDALEPSAGLPESAAARGATLRRRQRVGSAAGALLLAVGTGLVTLQLPTSRSGVAPAGTGCHASVDDGVLPTWARAGFSDPEPRARHILGERGRVVAILFGPALYAPPSAGVNNKILWVTGPTDAPQEPQADTDLVIDASLAGTTTTARRVVPGGSGPSIIDLPVAGCWHLDLRWGSRTQDRDALDLEYVAPPG